VAGDPGEAWCEWWLVTPAQPLHSSSWDERWCELERGIRRAATSEALEKMRAAACVMDAQQTDTHGV